MVADRPVADRSRIAACEQPALVVATASDPLHPEHIAHELAASLPAATFAQVPPRYLQPSRHTRACVAVIDDFLALHAHSHHDAPLGGAA